MPDWIKSKDKDANGDYLGYLIILLSDNLILMTLANWTYSIFVRSTKFYDAYFYIIKHFVKISKTDFEYKLTLR